MALIKTHSYPYKINPTYWKVMGYDEATRTITVGGFFTHASRLYNPEPPVVEKYVIDPYDPRTSFTTAELYEIISAEPHFAGATSDEQPA